MVARGKREARRPWISISRGSEPRRGDRQEAPKARQKCDMHRAPKPRVVYALMRRAPKARFEALTLNPDLISSLRKC